MEFKFKWKNLTRSDVIQYDGEKFVNVPVYTLRLQENQKGEGGNSYGDSSMVRWGLITDEYATLTVSGKSQKLALNEHKHSILDIENLESILNSKMGEIIHLGIDYSTGEPREDKAEYYEEGMQTLNELDLEQMKGFKYSPN